MFKCWLHEQWTCILIGLVLVLVLALSQMIHFTLLIVTTGCTELSHFNNYVGWQHLFFLSHLYLVLNTGLCPLARQLCKGGCPVGLRRELWSKALAVDTNQEVRSVL